MRPVRLRAEHHERSRRVGDAIRLERLLRAVHLDAGLHEDAEHGRRRAGIALAGGHEPCVRRFLRPALDRTPRGLDGVDEEEFAVAGPRVKRLMQDIFS